MKNQLKIKITGKHAIKAILRQSCETFSSEEAGEKNGWFTGRDHLQAIVMEIGK